MVWAMGFSAYAHVWEYGIDLDKRNMVDTTIASPPEFKDYLHEFLYHEFSTIALHRMIYRPSL